MKSEGRLLGPTEDEKEFHKWLAVLARSTNTHLEPMLISAYDHRLAPLGYTTVISAIKDILADRRPNEPFPSAREIAERISKPEDDKLICSEVADLILVAVSRKGVYWGTNGTLKPHQTFTEALQEELGELGALVVRNVGGWGKVVEICNREGVEKFRWHLKESTAVAIDKARKGTLDQKPCLPNHSTIMIQGRAHDTNFERLKKIESNQS